MMASIFFSIVLPLNKLIQVSLLNSPRRSPDLTAFKTTGLNPLKDRFSGNLRQGFKIFDRQEFVHFYFL